MAQAASEQTPRERAEALIKELGLTVESVFVPFSRSRNAKEKHPSLNWRVTLKSYAGKQTVLETDYSAGCAHCPAYRAAWHPAKSYEKQKAIAWECETGLTCRITSYGEPRAAGPYQLKPDTLDVIYSLVMNSDVIDHGAFESWAREYDYDPDSRKAEATYRACLEIALKLRNAIGDANLTRLREAFQEY